MSAIESREQLAGSGATRRPFDSSPSRKPSPPTTSEPPPTAGRSTSERTSFRKLWIRWTGQPTLPIRWHLVGHLQSNKARKAGAPVRRGPFGRSGGNCGAVRRRRLGRWAVDRVTGPGGSGGRTPRSTVLAPDDTSPHCFMPQPASASPGSSGSCCCRLRSTTPERARPFFRAARTLRDASSWHGDVDKSMLGELSMGDEPRFRGRRRGGGHPSPRRNGHFWTPHLRVTRALSSREPQADKQKSLLGERLHRMNVSPLDLRQQRFRSAIRGFDKVEVASFLAAVAARLRAGAPRNRSAAPGSHDDGSGAQRAPRCLRRT